ncbi:MAG: Rieske (2Fe-2S) protein [Deltaproteobacteria bacterium]|nr:Rieske (2Fe-2S) protein [Deltaproteobacteria bacterium]
MSEQQTRRSFLDWLLGAGMLAWLASVFYPVLRYLKPLPRATGAGPTRLSRDEALRIDQKGFVIVPVAGKRVLVLRDRDDKLYALAAKCTHEGCTVQFVPGESVIWCACHNARFDLQGRVLAGPPPRPLARYLVDRDEKGAIVVRAEA